jgi:hypothetical protein
MIDQNRAKLKQLLRDIEHDQCPGDAIEVEKRCDRYADCDDCYIDYMLELANKKEV